MSQKIGVVNLHLEVDMSDANNMTMFYKISQGWAQEEHYGLALARVVDLPSKVLEVAETVSKALAAKIDAKKKSSNATAVAKRRKLVLSLKEALKHAESSPMEGNVLLSWLRKLQDEFVRRMDQIECSIADRESYQADENADNEDCESHETEGSENA
jgi:DNA mismatch repair protein MSH4